MKRLVSLSLFVLLALVATGPAMAQTSKGFVTGVVEDQTGASIPTAAVKITHLTTGVSRDTVADGTGNFRIDAVDPGAYRLEASAQGFKTAKLDRIEVNAAQTVAARSCQQQPDSINCAHCFQLVRARTWIATWRSSAIYAAPRASWTYRVAELSAGQDLQQFPVSGHCHAHCRKPHAACRC